MKDSPRVLAVALCLALVMSPALAQEDRGAGAEDAAASRHDMDPRPLVRTGIGQDALARRYPEQARWLEPEDQERVLALLEPERRTPARGAILVVSDLGQGPDAELAGTLREPLARAGWAAMSVALPMPPYDPWPAAPSTMAASPGADDGADAVADTSVMIDVMNGDDMASAVEAYHERVAAILDTALAELGDAGYERRVLLGVGHGAGAATRFATAATAAVTELVWVSARFGPGMDADLPRALAGVANLRILELYSARADDNVVRERRAALARAGVNGYRATVVAMPPSPRGRDAQQLVNRISGWLGAQ